MPCGQEHLLDVERRVAERGSGFRGRGAERVLELVARLDDPHALAAAAGSGLEQHGVADLVRGSTRRCHGGRALRPRHRRHIGVTHRPARGDLVAHLGHHVCGRADENEVVVGAGLDEGGILGQESVARVHGLTACRRRRRDDRRDTEVALTRRGRPDADGVVGEARMERAGIGGRVDGDRFDPELVQCADDANRDLAAIRDQHAGEHP